jgi:hypothetical protein
MKLLSAIAWIFACSIVFPLTSLAHDVDHPNAHHQWFESLRVPGAEGDGAYGLGCCGIADCHVVPARAEQDGWQIYSENKWWTIPKRAFWRSTTTRPEVLSLAGSAKNRRPGTSFASSYLS